jgi:hypothetical protein
MSTRQRIIAIAAAAALIVAGLAIVGQPAQAALTTLTTSDGQGSAVANDSVPSPATHSVAAGNLAPDKAAPSVTPNLDTAANFEGIDEAAGFCMCQPADPNAAVSPSQIILAVNIHMAVFDKTGAVQCAFELHVFLNHTTDQLIEPHFQWDNVHNRFIFDVAVKAPARSATAAMWLGASQGPDACGHWNTYRVTFRNSSFPAGTMVDFPTLGQDRNALLIGTENKLVSGSSNFTVFGVSKADVYNGRPISFNTFNTPSLCAPVTNGGVPMISSAVSYFLCPVPGVGYRLFFLTNSGGPGARLRLQALVHSQFNAPRQRIAQAGTSATLDPGDGRIGWSPVFDGNRIWFAHAVDANDGHTAVRFGNILVTDDQPTVAVIRDNLHSDDFNPSIGVGFRQVNGLLAAGDFVFVNWASADAANHIPTTDMVQSFNAGEGRGVSNFIGAGTVVVRGATTTESHFGDYSSVAIDPSKPGTCAVTAQQYFGPVGEWRSRVARFGPNC